MLDRVADRQLWALTGFVVIAAFLLLAVYLSKGSPTSALTNSDSAGEEIEVREDQLVRTTEFSGNLFFANERTLEARRSGIVTSVPDKGNIVKTNEVLWEINGRPTIFLKGDVPMFRELSESASGGPDIRQLEQALTKSGFGPSGWDADETFDTTTTLAVEAFQRSHGLEADGSLGPDEIHFAATDIRVIETVPAGTVVDRSEVATVSSTSSEIAAGLSPGEVPGVRDAEESFARLGDGTELPVTLEGVETQALDDSEKFQYKATYRVDGDVGQAQPVQILSKKIVAEKATIVPVDALLSLANGDFAVEVVRPEGKALERVEVVDFADTDAAVTGALKAGDQVVVP